MYWNDGTVISTRHSRSIFHTKPLQQMYWYDAVDVSIRRSRCIDTTQHASLYNVADASTYRPTGGTPSKSRSRSFRTTATRTEYVNWATGAKSSFHTKFRQFLSTGSVFWMLRVKHQCFSPTCHHAPSLAQTPIYMLVNTVICKTLCYFKRLELALCLVEWPETKASCDRLLIFLRKRCFAWRCFAFLREKVDFTNRKKLYIIYFCMWASWLDVSVVWELRVKKKRKEKKKKNVHVCSLWERWPRSCPVNRKQGLWQTTTLLDRFLIQPYSLLSCQCFNVTSEIWVRRCTLNSLAQRHWTSMCFYTIVYA